MRQSLRRVGFTLVELVVVLAIVVVLAALLTMLFSALLKAQRQALLRERQRTEYARLDAILRNDVHTATEVILNSPTKCELSNQQGQRLIYELRDESLQRVRHKGDSWAIADTFYLRPGTQVKFRVDKENGRSLLQLNLDLAADANPASARQTPYCGQMMVGGSQPAERRAPAEERP
jgi:prepilin-type N-terminal cleavage/methylation domain-containing protein